MKRIEQNTAPVARRTARLSAAGVVTVAAAAVALPASVSRAAALFAFGTSQYGQIGDGSGGTGSAADFRTSPVPVVGMNFGVTALGAGGGHSLSVKGGAVYGWGLSTYGALGNGETASGVASRTTPQPALVLTSGVTALVGGTYHSVALAGGAVYTWGLNSDGQLANGTGVFAATATPTVVPALSSNVTAIASGSRHIMAIQNGALYAMGYNVNGQIGTGAKGNGTPNVTVPTQVLNMESGVTAASGGNLHSLAVKNGTLYAWGSNQYGQLGTNGITGTTTFDAFYGTPAPVVGFSGGVTDVSAGGDFTLALKGGVVYAWGRNNNGQLGTGDATNSPVPVAVPGIGGTIVDIEAGSTSAYALADDGSLWTWGNNSFGQLGLGTTDTPFREPQHLLPAEGYKFDGIDAGQNASHVLVTLSALPVYYTGAAGNSLNDVSNLAANLAGTTPAPIATVESTDVFFGAATATAGRLATATVATALNANSLTFGTGGSAGTAVTVSGPGTITLYADKNTYAAGTGIVVQTGAGAVTINAPIAVAAGQTWTNSSASPLTVAGGVALGTSTVTVGGTGTTNLTGPLTGTGGLAKTGAGTLRLTPAAYAAVLGGTSGIDLQDGQVVLDRGNAASPLAQVKQILDGGYANGFTAGQIRSTVRAAGLTIGYGDNAAGVVTIRVTLPGDADLDGDVDFGDFVNLQSSFGQSNTTFAQGNFDYNAQTDFGDFVLLQSNFGKSLTGGRAEFSREQYAAVMSITEFSQVPEPAVLSLVGLGAAGVLRRRRG